jgi:hypothetical protein
MLENKITLQRIQASVLAHIELCKRNSLISDFMDYIGSRDHWIIISFDSNYIRLDFEMMDDSSFVITIPKFPRRVTNGIGRDSTKEIFHCWFRDWTDERIPELNNKITDAIKLAKATVIANKSDSNKTSQINSLNMMILESGLKDYLKIQKAMGMKTRNTKNIISYAFKGDSLILDMKITIKDPKKMKQIFELMEGMI